MSRRLLVVALSLFAPLASAQTVPFPFSSGGSGGSGSSAFDAITTGTNTSATMTVGAGGILRSAAGILGAPSAATLPATCIVGDLATDNNATSGSQLYLCETTNTWVAVGTVSAPAFSAITGATNTTAAMVVGSGASLRSAAGIVGLPSTTSLPATCTVGDVHHDNNATTSAQLYLCEATNTWAVVGPAGGAAAFNAITGGTNTTAAMVVGSGASLRSAAGIFGVPASTTLPGTCTVGDSYMDTDATSGARWYLCEATNTWAVQTGGAGGGATVALDNLAAVAANVAISPGTTGSIELGSSTKRWEQVFLGGSTITASTPLIGGISTFNNSGVTFDLLEFEVTDTASAAISRLLDFKVAGTSVFNIRKNGGIAVPDRLNIYNGSSGTPYYTFRTSSGAYQQVAGTLIGWVASGSDSTGSPDTAFSRNAAGRVEVNTGTLNVYGDLILRHVLAAGTSPTIASGFGTSPSIAGKDDAGRLTVGTGGVASTGAVTFGTAYATAPACACNNETTFLMCRASATTTTLTLASATPFAASDAITWLCRGY